MKINLKTKNYCDVIFKDDQKRDLLLILPGGGYEYTSEREAMPVAKAFMPAGVHAAIFWYREEKLLYPALLDEALELIHELENLPQVNKLMVIGFSAGGHYASLMSTYLSDHFTKSLLIYPVISTLPKYAHVGSYENLLGKKFTGEDIEEVSTDLQVHENVPPTFLMHSMDDGAVPVENTINYLNALRLNHVYAECHIYPTGGHGISVLSKETHNWDMSFEQFDKEAGYIRSWVDLAFNFIQRDIK